MDCGKTGGSWKVAIKMETVEPKLPGLIWLVFTAMWAKLLQP